MKTNATLYARITNRLLDQMKCGTLPWLKPWTDGDALVGLPRNGATARPYSGINVIVLWASGFTDARWYTFNQARKLGGGVRRGEKGQEVLFFKTIARDDGDEDDERTFRIARSFHVFNHSQIDWPGDGPSTPPPEAYVDAQAIIAGSEAVIIHGGDQAMYRPLLDVISLPRFERFRTSALYFTTALHELVHWTGHKSRLARELASRDDIEAYAFEELVAELGAAFLAAQAGLPPDDRHHAAYLQTWIAVLEKDPGAFVRAASLARKATEFLMQTAAVEQAA